MPNLLGNVPPRINELGRETGGDRERVKDMVEAEKREEGLAHIVGINYVGYHTGANNLIIRSRSNSD